MDWHLFESADLVLGEFRCPPTDPRWSRRNRIDHIGPLIAIARRPVVIRQEGRPRVMADPTRGVLYSAGQPYRRELVSPEGDECSYIGMSHALAAEAAAGLDAAAADPATYRFPFSAASVRPNEYLLLHDVRARAEAVAGAAADASADAIREALYWIVSRVVARGYAEQGRNLARRPETLRDHADTVDAVRASLVRDLESRASLDALASSVGVSPFHLSRVFRVHTGQSIHAYRTDARLRASLDRIASGMRIADVAAQLGFASQAHITDRFKRAFGVTPQAWRNGLRAGPSEMSRIMEAKRERRPIA